MPLCQVAISATHLLRTQHWYQRALGMLPAGEHRHRETNGHASVPDLPELAFDVFCLVDQQEFFQIEMFEYQKPRMRTLPDDWRPSDIGYSTIGIHVTNFDAAVARIGRTSGRFLSEPIGPRGARRVCLRDPEGILLELMEDDPRLPGAAARSRPRVPVATRFITLSVPDLDRARAFWIGGLGLVESDVVLHGGEHEALWGLVGARRKSSVLWAGDFLVELVQYTTPIGRARPAGSLLSDQGILNVALGSVEKSDFDAVYRNVKNAGFRGNSAPWTLQGVATVVYVNDDQGFSVELLHVEPTGFERMGFIR